eukprot:SAG31_NODE_1213_length_9359_cov_4.298164_13_plen_206_part_00
MAHRACGVRIRSCTDVAIGLLSLAFAAAKTPHPGPRLAQPKTPPPPPLVLMPEFSFGPAFGTNMVLQQQPAKAAVYGYLGAGGTSVKVTVSSGGKDLYSIDADLQTTLHQPFGTEYGVKTFNHYNRSVPAWKALLKPTSAGGDYTITATCVGCSVNATQIISSVAFGDVCEFPTPPHAMLLSHLLSLRPIGGPPMPTHLLHGIND